MIKWGKLENYLIVVLLVGLVLFVAWRMDVFGLSPKRVLSEELKKNFEIWMENAKENLKEDFILTEGENYFFVKGRLASECTEFDPDSHCPISIHDAKINGNDLFTEDYRFTISSPDIFPYPVNEGINVLGFLNKEYSENVSLEFNILDYVPNKNICVRTHGYNKTLCSIKWDKRIFLDEPDYAGSLPADVVDFDYSFQNRTLEVFLRGEIESDDIPEATLGIYKDYETRKSLMNESAVELQGENGLYTFEFDGFFDLYRPQESYSLLLLVMEGNSFYATEWAFENEVLVNTVVYD